MIAPPTLTGIAITVNFKSEKRYQYSMTQKWYTVGEFLSFRWHSNDTLLANFWHIFVDTIMAQICYNFDIFVGALMTYKWHISNACKIIFCWHKYDIKLMFPLTHLRHTNGMCRMIGAFVGTLMTYKWQTFIVWFGNDILLTML